MEYVDWVSFVSSFLLVILLLGATLWGLKRYGRMQFQKQAGDARLVIVDSLSIGTRQRIALVETDGQRILVGITPHSISGLGQWPSIKSPSFSDAVQQVVAEEEVGDA